jgi:septum formation protein
VGRFLELAQGRGGGGQTWIRRSNQHTPGDLLIIAADTLVQSQGQILSKPANADDAATMIRQIRGRSHHVHTGLTLLDPINGARQVCADCAQVDVGDITDEAISNYVASGQWKGKSGGYNLAERISAGWPINVVGDPATVMGLPIARLRTLLPAFIAASARGAGAGGGPWA